jgi:hypothetical protein
MSETIVTTTPPCDVTTLKIKGLEWLLDNQAKGDQGSKFPLPLELGPT